MLCSEKCVSRWSQCCFCFFLQFDLSERQHAKDQAHPHTHPHPQWQQTVSYPTSLLHMHKPHCTALCKAESTWIPVRVSDLDLNRHQSSNRLQRKIRSFWWAAKKTALRWSPPSNQITKLFYHKAIWLAVENVQWNHDKGFFSESSEMKTVEEFLPKPDWNGPMFVCLCPACCISSVRLSLFFWVRVHQQNSWRR